MPDRSASAMVGCGCASPTRSALLAPGWEQPESPDGHLHEAIRDRAGRERGAASGVRCGVPTRGASEPEVLGALWDLVWAGEVTNDSLAPLRAVLAGGITAQARAACRPRPSRAASRAPGAARPAGGSRPLEPRGATPAAGAVRHRGGPRPGPAVARTPRGGHPRGGARRGCGRWLRLGLRRVEGARRARPGRGAATSSPGSAPPSSPCRARSTVCVPSASRPTPARVR